MLPSATATASDSPDAVAAPQPALDSAQSDSAFPAVNPVMPTFVAWSEKVLGRVVKTFTKIVDRVRVSSLMTRLKKLKLLPEQEKQIEAKIKFKEEAVSDFNAALTYAAVTELNNRRVPGAQHSHWLDLALTTGELVSCHLDVVDVIEKIALENAVKEKSAPVAPKK
jgi:hypothetical protein